MKAKKYLTKDGQVRYEINAYLGLDSATGEEVRARKKGFLTAKEAQLYAQREKLEFSEKRHKKLNRRYRFDELYQLWLIDYEKTVKPVTFWSTQDRYRLRIKPYIGNHYIHMIDYETCQNMVDSWMKNYADCGHMRAIVKEVLRLGQRLGLISMNPMELVKIPIKPKFDPNGNFYEMEDLQRLLQALDDYGHPKFLAFFRLLAMTGMRKGEALGLRWTDIDFKHRTIKIERGVSYDASHKPMLTTPKTRNAVRMLSVDEDTLRILKRWKLAQTEAFFAMGISTNHPDQMIFTTDSNNTLIYPTVPNQWLDHVIKKYQLPKITVHGLRHTHCTLLFEMGTPLDVVKERLGHGQIETTMNIYNHVTNRQRDTFADNFSAYLKENNIAK